MDDSLIYIIFLAVSALAGLYKNYSKKKAEQRKRQTPQPQYDDIDSEKAYHEPQPEKKTNPFEEFLRQQLEGTLIEEPEPEPVQEFKEVETPKPKFDLDDPKIAAITKEGVAAFQNSASEFVSDSIHDADFTIPEAFSYDSDKIKDAISTNQIGQENKILQEFDIKKAIIYSEIMNRPKF